MYSVLWGIPATVIVMSFLYGVTALYSIAKDLKRRIWINDIDIGNDNNDLPNICVIIPLYKEDKQSIMETFRSIANQRYPPDKLSVYIVLENGDEDTKMHVRELLNIFSNASIHVQIYVNNGKRSSKASAMNAMLNHILDKYIAIMVLDAGDRVIDEYYIRKCAELIKRGYNIIGAKVYRIGEGIIAKLSYVDTILWYNIGLPGIHSLTKVPFLSGEGMVVTTRFLNTIGKFPEVLAEDTYIAMLSLIHKEKIALLDSVVIEGAPATLKSLIKQRLRWYKGILECLKDFVIRYRKNVTRFNAIMICVAYIRTIVLIAPLLSLIIVILSLFIYIPSYMLLIAEIELISIFISPIFIYFTNNVKDSKLFLAPFSWLLQSSIALAAIIPIKIPWLRTSERSKVTI